MAAWLNEASLRQTRRGSVGCGFSTLRREMHTARCVSLPRLDMFGNDVALALHRRKPCIKDSRAYGVDGYQSPHCGLRQTRFMSGLGKVSNRVGPASACSGKAMRRGLSDAWCGWLRLPHLVSRPAELIENANGDPVETRVTCRTCGYCVFPSRACCLGPMPVRNGTKPIKIRDRRLEPAPTCCTSSDSVSHARHALTRRTKCCPTWITDHAITCRLRGDIKARGSQPSPHATERVAAERGA